MFLDKAKKNLQAAQILFDSQLYDSCASRAYYAAFQAALTALSAANIETGRIRHAALQATFNTEFIRKRKVYPAKLKSYLLDLQSVRIDADYKVPQISKKDALTQLRKAKEFIDAVIKELNK